MADMKKQVVIKYGEDDNMQIDCDWNDGIKLVQALATTLGAVLHTLFANNKQVLYEYIIETQRILMSSDKINFPNAETQEVTDEQKEEKK